MKRLQDVRLEALATALFDDLDGAEDSRMGGRGEKKNFVEAIICVREEKRV